MKFIILLTSLKKKLLINVFILIITILCISILTIVQND